MKKKRKKMKKGEILFFTIGFIIIGIPVLFMIIQFTESIFPAIEKNTEGLLENKYVQNVESRTGTHFIFIFDIKTVDQKNIIFKVNKNIYNSHEINEILYITYNETKLTRTKKIIKIVKKENI